MCCWNCCFCSSRCSVQLLLLGIYTRPLLWLLQLLLLLPPRTWCCLRQQLGQPYRALLVCRRTDSALAFGWVNEHVAYPGVHAAGLSALQQPKQAFPAILA